jgi:hypothetical protein
MAERRLLSAFLLLALVVPLSGCAAFEEPLIVAASAPRAASGMTLFVVTEKGLLEGFQDLKAEYRIYFGDRLIYPAGGQGGVIPIEGRTGSAFVPYNNFVVGNGEYDVVVSQGGTEVRTRVHVEKWVQYVRVQPMDKGDRILVQAALSSATGAKPDDRILSEGDLLVTMKYRGKDGREERTIGQVATTTRNDHVSTTVEVPRFRLSQGAGYYSFEPLFHNAEAVNNVQVPGDPTMANAYPPANWIYVNG